MRTGLTFNLKELTVCRPSDLPYMLELIRMHFNAALKGLERHFECNGIHFDELDDKVAEIQFLEDSKVKILIRDEETGEELPYTTKITFPSIGSLAAHEIKPENKE